jgi:lipopolysaccharide export system protein LptC
LREGAEARQQAKRKADEARNEMDQNVYEFEEDERARREHEEVRRNQLFEMMQANIEQQKRHAAADEKAGRATDHLINPVEFQAMD